MDTSKKTALRAPTRSRVPFAAPFAVGALALALAACGGSSGDGPATAAAQDAPAAVKIGGVAATGAPLAGATVKVHDATGAQVCEVTTGADGAYSCDLGPSPKAPFVIQAEIGDVKLVSAFGAAASGTANITPITTLIAATLAADGNPASLISSLAQGGAAPTPDALKAAVDKVTTALKPLTDLLGATIDPISGTFAADGTGYDKVLDALQVSIRPDGTTSNVEVTVKAVPTAEDGAPVSISFQANASSLPPLPATIDLGDVASTNVPAAIADLLSRANACYALPTAQRVTDGTNPGSTVSAAACRSLFLQDDPSTFLSNGSRVGPQAGAAFGSLFRDGATGAKWENGAFSFFRVNRDWVLTYRYTSADGNVSNEQIVARNVGGSLKIVGNDYAYGASVRPIVQFRDHLNTPAASSLSVGYNVNIANRTDGSGNPIFAKAEVTTPRGVVFTYTPTAGLSYLVIERGGAPTATPIIRLAGKLTAPGATAHPGDVDTGLFFGDRTVWTEDAIRAIPDQSVWKIEFFHADGVTPNVVQAYRTVSRAPTLAEASQVKFADVLPANKERLRSQSSAGFITFPGTPNAQDPQFAYLVPDDGSDFWGVPAGAVAPSSVNLYGRAPSNGARFNDGANVPSTGRKATIQCSAQSVGDAHCAASPYRNQYATGSTANLIELWGRDARQVEYSTMNALYRLTVPQ